MNLNDSAEDDNKRGKNTCVRLEKADSAYTFFTSIAVLSIMRLKFIKKLSMM